MSHGPGSPEKSRPGTSTSPTKEAQKKITRYGVVSSSQPAFAKEERFAWQKAQYLSDSMYDVKDEPNTKNVLFGTSLRKPLSDGGKSSTGPGSYDFIKCYDHSSEYSKSHGNKFACAPRQSMAIKTPSPGAVYNIVSIILTPEPPQPSSPPLSSHYDHFLSSLCVHSPNFAAYQHLTSLHLIARLAEPRVAHLTAHLTSARLTAHLTYHISPHT
jgi:hypothetical protein